MDPGSLVSCGALLHGHSCPPLVLGLRAGGFAVSLLGVRRAAGRELFAMVEMGSDHYAQGFADGVQLATGCTFGKDLIVRVPHGKFGLRLVDQARGRAIRVVPRPEALARIQESSWFRACESSGTPWEGCEALTGPVIEEILSADDAALFASSAVFPMRVDDRTPAFETFECAACGETTLVAYARASDGRALCIPCDERRRDRRP